LEILAFKVVSPQQR